MAAVVGVCCLAASTSVWAPPLRRGPPIQFSEPANPALTTNLNTLTVRKQSALQKMEEELRQPFRMLDREPGAGSERMLSRPPAGPVIQSPKVRELLDRQKNWVFVKPEEQLGNPRDSRLLQDQEVDETGKPREKLSVVEQYFENLLMQEAGLTNRAADQTRESADAEVWGGGREVEDPARSAASAQLREREGSLRQFFDADTQVLPDLNRNTSLMPDLFDTKGADSYQSRAREMRMEQFKQTLPVDAPRSTALPSPALPSTSGTALGGMLGGPRSIAAPVSPPSRPAVSSFGAPVSSGIPATPGLSGISSPTPPPPEPVRKPMPSPFTEIPKRRF